MQWYAMLALLFTLSMNQNEPYTVRWIDKLNAKSRCN